MLVPGTNQEVDENNAFISSRGNSLVSGMKAQKKIALEKLQTTKTRKYLQPTFVIAGEVICPIIVLKANETMTPIETPLDLVLVSKTSAGMIHDREPQVKEKLT